VKWFEWWVLGGMPFAVVAVAIVVLLADVVHYN